MKQLPPALLSRLSVMMFLQYAIWGAWLPLMYPFLSRHRGFADSDIGYLFMIGGVGAIFAPFIAGHIADRFFNTEKYLAISHIVGGVLVWQLSWIENYWLFFTFAFLYSMIYSPTLALTNSLSFHHLPDRDRQFGRVRLWGTIGWIAVGIGIGQWLLHVHTPAAAPESEQLATQARGIMDAFRLSAILGVGMGLYCLTLPATPAAKEKKSYAAFDALAEVRRQPLITLFLLAVPISCIHQFYFVHTSAFLSTYQTGEGLAQMINRIFGVGGGGLMTIGQMAEIVVLAVIPLLTARFSRKALLATGVVAYGLRMFLFAYVDVLPFPEMVTLMAGIALHGLCFGCFVIVAFLVVDEQTTPAVRASAQSLFGLVVFGIGIVVGSIIAGYVGDWARIEGVMDYRRLFSAPMWGAVAVLILLAIFYPGGRVPVVEAPRTQDETE